MSLLVLQCHSLALCVMSPLPQSLNLGENVMLGEKFEQSVSQGEGGGVIRKPRLGVGSLLLWLVLGLRVKLSYQSLACIKISDYRPQHHHHTTDIRIFDSLQSHLICCPKNNFSLLCPAPVNPSSSICVLVLVVEKRISFSFHPPSDMTHPLSS